MTQALSQSTSRCLRCRALPLPLPCGETDRMERKSRLVRGACRHHVELSRVGKYHLFLGYVYSEADSERIRALPQTTQSRCGGASFLAALMILPSDKKKSNRPTRDFMKCLGGQDSPATQTSINTGAFHRRLTRRGPGSVLPPIEARSRRVSGQDPCSPWASHRRSPREHHALRSTWRLRDGDATDVRLLAIQS